MTAAGTGVEGKKSGRFPGVERLFVALTFAAFTGAGSVSLLGGGVAMWLTAAAVTMAIYLREVVRGGTSWRELLLLVPIAIVILIGLHVFLSDEPTTPAVGAPHVIGIGGQPRSLEVSTAAVWIASVDGTLSTISPTGILNQVQLPGGLRDVTFGFGYAWVARGRELLAVGAKSLEVVGRHRFGSQVAALAASRRGIWIMRPGAARVDRVNPATGGVEVALAVRQVRAISTDRHHLWALQASPGRGPGRLLEYDEGGQLRQRIDLAPNPRALAVGGRFVWVSYYDDGDLTQVTKATGEKAEVSTGSASISGIALGPASVWAIDEQGEDLTEVEPGERRVVGQVNVGPQPVDVAFWHEAVFVISGLDGIVKIFPISLDGSGERGTGFVATCP